MTAKKRKNFKPLIDDIKKAFEKQNATLLKERVILRDASGKIIGAKLLDN